MNKKKKLLAIVLIAMAIIGGLWYQYGDHQRYVKVKGEEDLTQLTYTAPTDYMLLLMPNGDSVKEEISYIAPIDSLDSKPKKAYSTGGRYMYLYNNLEKSNRDEIQLYDDENKKLKTVTFTGARTPGSAEVKEENKSIKIKDSSYIISAGYTNIIQKPNLYKEFNYDVKIDGQTYQIIDIVSMSNYYILSQEFQEGEE